MYYAFLILRMGLDRPLFYFEYDVIFHGEKELFFLKPYITANNKIRNTIIIIGLNKNSVISFLSQITRFKMDVKQEELSEC